MDNTKGDLIKTLTETIRGRVISPSHADYDDETAFGHREVEVGHGTESITRKETPMKTSKLKPITLILVIAALGLGLGTLAADMTTAEAGWAVKGTWFDTCSCKVSCTCFMGSGPTEHFCEGSSLVEIDEGHYGGVELDGLKAMFSHRIGEWARVYVTDTATAEQVDALRAVIPLTIPFIEDKMIETVEVVPISVERTETTVKFSAPETTVDLEIVLGANGKPVSISNLPLKGLPFPEVLDHWQYKSVLSKHQSEAHSFEWSGRNGFVAKIDRGGDLPTGDS